MKKTETIVIVVIFVIIGISIAVIADSEKTVTGFFWPTGTSQLGNFAKFLAADENEYFAGKFHIGYDIEVNVGDEVYAISSGTIVYIDRSLDWGAGNVALIIEHKLQNGQKFYAIYGHIKSSLLTNQAVEDGQLLGTIGNYSYGAHLHFGICLRDEVPRQNLGMLPIPEGWNGDKNKLDIRGYTDPIKFITTQSPFNVKKVTIPLVVPSPTPTETSKIKKIIKLVSTGPEYKIKKTIYIDAKWSWTDTSIDCNNNDQIFIRAWGKAMYAPINGYLGPEGVLKGYVANRIENKWNFSRGCYVDKDGEKNDFGQYFNSINAPQGSLIAKIGDQGRPFYIGPKFTGKVVGYGRLYLGINDTPDVMWDNDGGWTVEVIIK